MEKIVGVLGGMGPDATVDFMSEVIRITGGARDQDHLHMIIDHNPKVPDRQAAIREDGGDVGGYLAAMARRLETAGADFLVMPCNTAQVFADSIRQAVSVPLIDIVDVTVAEVIRIAPEAKNVGLLATAACLDTGIYQKALSALGVVPVLPAAPDDLMKLIFEIKSGNRVSAVAEKMAEVAGELVSAGADVIVAGCTEIPLVLSSDNVSVPLVSSTEVLAKRTVQYAMSG